MYTITPLSGSVNLSYGIYLSKIPPYIPPRHTYFMKKKQLLKKNPWKNPGRNPLITGTIILTLTGFASRIIGFFYRIYLSRLFGEEGMGVYQLLNPVLALSFSVTAAGLQTSISKYVAGEISSGNAKSPFRVLMMGLSVSLCLSLFCTGAVIHFSEWIAVHFLLEERTASMLRIIALSIPLSAVHACINGYYYGIRKTALPAFTQLLEQFCRIFCVYSAERLAAQNGTVPSINVAVAGLVVGEFFAMLVCIGAVYFRYYRAVSAPAAPAAPSSDADEYDSVPKTGDSALYLWLFGLSAVLLAGSLALRKSGN